MQPPAKSRGRRGYAPDLKQRVLARLASGEVSLRQVAREFEISVPTLIKWRREEQTDASKRVRGTAGARPQETDSASELQRLREEVERLRQERDRLRRGIAVLVGVKVSQ